MKLIMNQTKEKPKRGRPKKAIVKFGSLQVKEYCCLPGGEDLYMKIKKGSKKKNCIVMQTGQAASLPLDQIVHRVERETIRPAVPQLEMVEKPVPKTIKLGPAQPQQTQGAQQPTVVKFPHAVDIEPDVIIDLDDDED